MNLAVGPFVQLDRHLPGKTPAALPQANRRAATAPAFAGLFQTLTEEQQLAFPETFAGTGTLGRDMPISEDGADCTAPNSKHRQAAELAPRFATPAAETSINRDTAKFERGGDATILRGGALDLPVAISPQRYLASRRAVSSGGEPVDPTPIVASATDASPMTSHAEIPDELPAAQSAGRAALVPGMPGRPCAGGTTNAVFVAVQAMNQSVRVYARVGAMEEGERERLRGAIRQLLAQHGLTDASLSLHESSAPTFSPPRKD